MCGLKLILIFFDFDIILKYEHPTQNQLTINRETLSFDKVQANTITKLGAVNLNEDQLLVVQGHLNDQLDDPATNKHEDFLLLKYEHPT